MMNKGERFAEFLRRLGTAPAASDSEEAIELVSATLNAVEDESSGVPFNPGAWQTDGRLYPVQADNAFAVGGRPDLLKLRRRGHATFVRDNGAISIRTVDGVVVLDKLGSDGRGVDI